MAQSILRSPSVSSDGDDSDSENQIDEENYRHDSQGTSRNTSPRPESRPVTRLPSIPSFMPSPEGRASRQLNLSNMLNPSPGNNGSDISRRRTADQANLDTPQRISSTPKNPPVTRSVPASPCDDVLGETQEQIPSIYNTLPRTIRQAIGPSRKISSLRNNLLPMINTQPPVKIDAQQTPFPGNMWSPVTVPSQQRYPEHHVSSPGSMLTSQYSSTTGFPFPSISHTKPQMQSRAASVSSNVPSPITSPYPYSHSGTGMQHNRPLGTPPIASYGAYSPRYGAFSTAQGSPMSTHQSLGLTRDSYPSVMHMSTAEGQHLSIPIDTNAASKVADEKRKRNAGASARFRQRRKEREREMSMRISELEQKLRGVEQERDHFRNLALKYAGAPLPSTSVSSNTPVIQSNTPNLRLSPRLVLSTNATKVTKNEEIRLSPISPFQRRSAEMSSNMEGPLGSKGLPGSIDRHSSLDINNHRLPSLQPNHHQTNPSRVAMP